MFVENCDSYACLVLNNKSVYLKSVIKDEVINLNPTLLNKNLVRTIKDFETEFSKDPSISYPDEPYYLKDI